MHYRYSEVILGVSDDEDGGGALQDAAEAAAKRLERFSVGCGTVKE
jgi:hypothetical protein